MTTIGGASAPPQETEMRDIIEGVVLGIVLSALAIMVALMASVIHIVWRGE